MSRRVWKEFKRGRHLERCWPFRQHSDPVELPPHGWFLHARNTRDVSSPIVISDSSPSQKHPVFLLFSTQLLFLYCERNFKNIGDEGLVPWAPAAPPSASGVSGGLQARLWAEGDRSSPRSGRRQGGLSGGRPERGGQEGAGRGGALRSASSAACTAHRCPLLLRSF